MAVARDDLGRAARKRGIEGQATTIRHFGVKCIADYITSTGQNIKWDLIDILGSGRSDVHRKIKETLLIRDLQPALNENIGSKKLFLFLFVYFFFFWWGARGVIFLCCISVSKLLVYCSCLPISYQSSSLHINLFVVISTVNSEDIGIASLSP